MFCYYECLSQILLLGYMFTCLYSKYLGVLDHTVSHSVMSDSFWPHGLYPTRVLCPWNSSGKNTRVGCQEQIPRSELLDHKGCPGGSDGKESTCNARDLGLIPGWEDTLEEGMATHSSILGWRIPLDRGAWWATVHGVTKSQTRLSDQTTTCS